MKKHVCFSFKIKIFISYIFLFFLSGIAINTAYSQADSLAANSRVEAEKRVVNVPQTAREELHRYMGYEELLPKYISMPYDVTMNTNLGSQPFIDIGYLLLMFLPLCLLFGLKNKLLKLLVGSLLTLFLIISVPTGYRASHIYTISQKEVPEALTQEIASKTFVNSPITNLKLRITQVADYLYRPFQNLIVEKFSGEGDAITYPICFGLFLILTFFLRERIKDHAKGEQAVIYFALFYGFLWWILAAGVPWYGILLLPLSIILLVVGTDKGGKQQGFLRNSLLIFSAFWLISSLAYRFGNYNLGTAPQKELRWGAIHSAPMVYGLGLQDKQGLMDFLYPGYGPVINEINNNPKALVYRVGTYFQYFIHENNERVLEDNQLGTFNAWSRQFPDKVKLAEFMKSQGYEYLIVDFNAANIDLTPEGSLTEKVLKLQDFVSNPALQAIGTDRIVLNQNNEQVYGLSGVQLVSNGTFAAFKIR